MELHDFIIAVTVLLFGFIVGYFWPNRKPHYDGTVEITGDAKKIFCFDLDIEPEEFLHKEHIVFRVSKKDVS